MSNFPRLDETGLNTLLNKIATDVTGQLDDLETTEKSSLVGAINETRYKEWSGTQAQYAAAVAQGLIADGTIVTITDSPVPTGTLEEHVSTFIHSATGIHGIRYYQDKLEYYDETTETWVEIETGSDITIDSSLSSTSENPVQNKVINTALDGKLDTSGNAENVTVDTFTASSASMPTLTAGETLKVLFGKLVKWMSDVVSALNEKQDKLTSKGSATKGVYVDSNGAVQAMTYEVNKTVPSDAVFTDTTYESKSASSGGTATSLVTTGEKYTWNNSIKAQANAGFHNAVYRGKYLGSSLTTEQKAAITSGTFENLYIGDYWTIGGVNYRIAAFDYWLHSGDRECTNHHVVIVPDTNLDTQKMNDSNSTTGGYIGSKMYTSYITTTRNKVISAFGSANILSHRQLFTNAVEGNYASNWAWYNSTIDLMSESMVYGALVGGKGQVGSVNLNIGIDKVQLPLFALDPSRITNRANWWLRDVVSSSLFTFTLASGDVGNYGASNSIGIRPAFAIY